MEFIRHSNQIEDSKILYILNDNKEQVNIANTGDNAYIILNITPIAGGQLGIVVFLK